MRIKDRFNNLVDCCLGMLMILMLAFAEKENTDSIEIQSVSPCGTLPECKRFRHPDGYCDHEPRCDSYHQHLAEIMAFQELNRMAMSDTIF